MTGDPKELGLGGGCIGDVLQNAGDVDDNAIVGERLKRLRHICFDRDGTQRAPVQIDACIPAAVGPRESSVRSSIRVTDHNEGSPELCCTGAGLREDTLASAKAGDSECRLVRREESRRCD